MTRTSKKLKIVVSLLAVVIVLSSIAIVPVNAAYDPFWVRARAFVASAITALNIGLSSATMTATDIVDYVVDPLEVTYTYADAWADRPEIQIWDDYTTIDGVKYTDIWISNEAAEKFRVNAFDFATAYQIASNDSGTFASGVGTYDGIPLYNNGTVVQSQHYTFDKPTVTTFQPVSNIGGGLDGRKYNNATSRFRYNYVNGGSTTEFGSTSTGATKQEAYFVVEQNTPKIRVKTNNDNFATRTLDTQFLDLTPFDYDYVSQTIPSDVPLGPDEGMMIRIPSYDSHGDKYLYDFLNDYPEFNQGEPVTIDVNLDPNIMTKLEDLIDIIIPIIPIINNNIGDVTFEENHVTPQPQPVPPAPQPFPDADTNITEITYGDYYTTEKYITENQTQAINNNVSINADRIIESIENNSTNVIESIEDNTTQIEFINDTLDHIDAGTTYISQDVTSIESYTDQINDNVDNINDNVENIDQTITSIDLSIDQIFPILSNIIQAIQNIPSYFSNITTPIINAITNLGNTIVQDIEEGPIRLLDKLIDVLRSLFFPILATLRGFLGIWHYVVTWMSNISAPFTWIMGLMAGASPILVSPIYALIAGIIVIAVYRRFGR